MYKKFRSVGNEEWEPELVKQNFWTDLIQKYIITLTVNDIAK